MVAHYFQKIFMVFNLVFLGEVPFAQIIIAVVLRLGPGLFLVFQQPFHYIFMKYRELTTEACIIVITAILLILLDEGSDKGTKIIIGYVVAAVTILMLLGHSAVNIWAIKQDDIIFDPPKIINEEEAAKAGDNVLDFMAKQEKLDLVSNK